MRKALKLVVLCAILVSGPVFLLRPELDAWFVADDFVHLAYFRYLLHPFGFFVRPAIGPVIFRPLSLSLEFFMFKLFGDSPTALHGGNLVLHALNAMAVFFFLRRFLSSRSAGERKNNPSPEEQTRWVIGSAFAGALIFAVHPVSLLTAVWFACRADLFATFFSVSALLLAAGEEKPGNARLGLLFLFCLCALLCKVTHLPLPALVFLVGFSAAAGMSGRERMKRAFLKFLPALDAALIYLCWRMLVLGSLGTYEPVPDSFSGFLAQVSYHLPRVISLSFRDLLFHHLESSAPAFLALAAGLGLCLLVSLPGLVRGRASLLAGALFTLLAVSPAWNLSHMLVFREERLLYLPLVGLALAACSLPQAGSRAFSRAIALLALLFAAAIYGLYAREPLRKFRLKSEENKALAEKLKSEIEKNDPRSAPRRIYVLGLESEHYYLDMMVKTVLSPAFADRVVMTGDMSCFVLLPESAKGPLTFPEGLPREALPRRIPRPTPKGLSMETVEPPDLLSAARFDRHAAILEWSGESLENITPELRSLYHRRRAFRRNADHYATYLPSFNFLNSPLPFNWKLSPGLSRKEPGHRGEPYLFLPENDDPYLISPPLSFPALAAARMRVEMKLPEKSWLPPGRDRLCMMWESAKKKGFSRQRTICAQLRPTGGKETYLLDLNRNVYWARSGRITRIRLDPVSFRTPFELYELEFTPD